MLALLVNHHSAIPEISWKMLRELGQVVLICGEHRELVVYKQQQQQTCFMTLSSHASEPASGQSANLNFT